MLTKLAAGLHSIIAVPLFLALSMLMAGVVALYAMVRPRSPVIERIIRLWSRTFLLAAAARLTIEGREKIDESGQYVFVANHLSNLDIPVMFLTAPVPIRYLAKKEVYKIPFVAAAMRQVGMVKVNRESSSSIHAEVNAGVAAAKARGHSLIIFPEGTRSVTGELQLFKKGAFRIAIINNLAVVPVTIQGTREVWAPGSKLLFSGHIRTTIHDPIPTTDLQVGDIDALRGQIRETIRSDLRGSSH